MRPDSLIAKNYTMSLKDGFVIDGTPGFTLMPFDEVSVFKSPGTIEQQNVEVDGEVMFAGTYTLSKRNARLSDLIAAAGGATNLAYIKGARLERRTNEAERTRMQAAYRMAIEQQQKNMLELAARSNNASAVSQMAEKGQSAQLQKFEVPGTYQVGIELETALSRPGSDADLVLREGDRRGEGGERRAERAAAEGAGEDGVEEVRWLFFLGWCAWLGYRRGLIGVIGLIGLTGLIGLIGLGREKVNEGGETRVVVEGLLVGIQNAISITGRSNVIPNQCIANHLLAKTKPTIPQD